jgi:Tfp pilus assembly protein PilF
MDSATKRNTVIGISVLSLVAFFPVFSAGFVNYDDPEYVLNNPYIRQFSTENIRYIFAGKSTDLYVPLTIFSYTIEYSLFGESAKVFHATNLLLHIINAILLLPILLRLGIKNNFLIYTILLFFTLNPLVTESVCWITERKDVLYCLFFLLSAIQFLKYVESRQLKHIGLCFLFFILSCLSKPMAVSLPLLLSICLIYQEQKFKIRQHMMLIPFYASSVLFSIVSVLSLIHAGTVKANIIYYSIPERTILIFAELGYYFIKPFIPFQQTLFHLFPEQGKLFSNSLIMGFACIALAIIGLMIWQTFKKKDRLIGFIFLAWLVFLAPVLQIYSNTHSYVSERYFYLSIIFPVSIVFLLLQKTRIKAEFYKYAVFVFAIAFVVLTFKRSSVWKNSKTLFEAELKIDPKNPHALNNMGYYYNTTSNFAKSSGLLKQAVEIDPTNAFFLNNYGWALANLGKTDQAIIYFQKAIDHAPDYTEALNNIGVAFMQKREPEKAAGYFKKAYNLNPGNPDVAFNLGLYYYNSGKKEIGLPILQKAYELGNKKALKYLNK